MITFYIYTHCPIYYSPIDYYLLSIHLFLDSFTRMSTADTQYTQATLTRSHCMPSLQRPGPCPVSA